MKAKTVKAKYLVSIWNALHATVPYNENPYKVMGQRCLFKIQPEIEFMSKLSDSEMEALGEAEVSIPSVPIPEFYGNEHAEALDMITDGDLKPRGSMLASHQKNHLKNGESELREVEK